MFQGHLFRGDQPEDCWMEESNNREGTFMGKLWSSACHLASHWPECGHKARMFAGRAGKQSLALCPRGKVKGLGNNQPGERQEGPLGQEFRFMDHGSQ